MNEDIFLSYKREDKARAEIFVDAFKKTDLSLWWDDALDAGEIYRAIIQKKLEENGCVVVLWSENSVKQSDSIEPSFVWDEANKGKQLNKLVPVLIDDVTPPPGFGEIQTLNLVGWKGDIFQPAFTSLVKSIKKKINGKMPNDNDIEKIEASKDPRELAIILDDMRKEDEERAILNLGKSRDSIKKKIRASKDPEAIGALLDSIRWIDKAAARSILSEIVDYVESIGNDMKAQGKLIDIIGEIDEEIEKRYEKRMKIQ